MTHNTRAISQKNGQSYQPKQRMKTATMRIVVRSEIVCMWPCTEKCQAWEK